MAVGGAKPTFVQHLSDFLEARPEWRDNIHPIVVAHPVQRMQRSGLCYMHAPVVVQHYLVSMHTGADGGMINLASMIRDTWSGKELTDYIFNDRGGNSHSLLKQILVPGSATMASHSSLFADHLHQFGPALVSMFDVHDDFYNATCNNGGGSFDGVVSGPRKGLHAMVLVGARTDANGKRWFLLQNWWPEMQFVEVSKSYLESSGATVYFVETPQPHIPKVFPQYKAAYAESGMIDKEESPAMLEGR
jgi:hypothetical protein